MAYKILAADSSPSALKAIHLAFQNSVYNIYTSDNGINALELLMQINPDAVVVGLALEGKDGYEIARYLKSGGQFRRIPVILLADAFDPPDKEKLKNLEFDALFQ
jgi:CheY-like chemotaxis protein